ncbi:unnamed protein product [Durusdinium trenchii]|uniref:1-phosphatidylinositol 4-kinase n=1 Tax=Durusdinium trenchii TaxID=1381693 RepID=A0ABP0MP99_9DINO
MSGGSLLRLFRSEYFDAHLHMHYLLRMEQSGVQDYLVNELYKMTDDDVDYYLPQLSQVALLRYNKSSLHRFLLDKAAQSLPFALKIHWLVRSIVEDRTPELYENAMAMLNLCEAAMVNSGSSRAKHEEVAPGPPHVQRILRSSSDPDLQSNRKPSVDDLEERDVLTPKQRSRYRRSRTPGPMRSREADGAPEVPPTPTDSETDHGLRFHPPPRQISGESSVDENLEATPGASGLLSEAEALRAAAVRHLAALEQAFTPEERAQALGSSCPNAFICLGLPVAGHGNEEEVLEDERARECMMKKRRCDYFNTQNQLVSMIMSLSGVLISFADKADRKTALAATLTVLNRWLLDRRISMAACGEGPFFLLGAHIPPGRGQRGRGLGAESVRTGVRKPTNGTERDGAERTGPVSAGGILLWTGFKNYQTTRWSMNYTKKCQVQHGHGERALFAIPKCSWLRVSLLFPHLDALNPIGCGTTETTPGSKPSLPRLWRDLDSLHQILHVHVDLCRIFSSATRAPFVLAYESANLDEVESDEAAGHVSHQTLLHQPALAEAQQSMADRLSRCVLQELRLGCEGSAGMDEGEPTAARLHQLLKQVTPDQWKSLDGTVEKSASKDEPDLQELDGKTMRAEARKRKEEAARTRHRIWGELWREKVERVRAASPYSRYSSWRLSAVMVKGGDDLRQELLASQIIEQFSAIFQEAGLPLWLKATKVLVTSSTNGFLEFIPDSISVDAMKKLFPGKTLAEIFKVAFADRMFEAKKNFIESSAAYSLVVYFLQVKDRHNGNLMLLTSGHVVHIDFGFMLSNSPGGNMAFENSPFKLTQEILDVMDGECSEQYEYFRTLLIRGFLEARKHMERIVLQVRMMLVGSKMPCFREGADFVLSTLQDRFFCNLTEEACIEKVVELIDTSVNNWRTIQYDNYQRLVNGIL